MGKYLIKKPVIKFGFFILDLILALIIRRTIPSKKTPYNKILICNMAHLGDVVITTSVLPVIKKALPNCKIGFLIGSWSRPLLEGHPLIDYIHTVDHWKVSRQKSSLWQKIKIYRRTRKAALGEIISEGYDAALDLYPYFPNAIGLLHKAAIPCRIGYESGGFGPLLTKALSWQTKDQYMGYYHMEMLSCLDITTTEMPRPSLFVSGKGSWDLPDSYIIFHVGSGAAEKNWLGEHWRSLTKAVAQIGVSVVFTGQGVEEKCKIDAIIEGLPHCIDMVGRLALQELMQVVRQSKLVVAADSVVIHMAGGFQVPSISIYCGINNPKLWTPPGATALYVDLPCVPCGRGCSERPCINKLDVQAVFGVICRQMDVIKDGSQERL